MKYFTPELLEELNQQMGNENWTLANSAMQRWNKNSTAYDKRLKTIRSRVASSVLDCVEQNCWHDAQVLNLSYQDQDKLALLLVQGDQLHVLICTLSGAPTLTSPASPPAFASVGLFWLYEELDVDHGATVLRVLLSDGSELEIPVAEISIQSFDVHPHDSESSRKKSKRTASNSRDKRSAKVYGRNVPTAEFALFELSPLIPPRDRLSKEVRFPIVFRQRDASAGNGKRRSTAAVK